MKVRLAYDSASAIRDAARFIAELTREGIHFEARLVNADSVMEIELLGY